MYLLVTIVAYIVIVKGLGFTEGNNNTDVQSDKTDSTNDTNNDIGLNDNEDENDVSQGAAGQMNYHIGYTH